MKLFLSVLFALPLAAQSNVLYSWTIKAAPNDAAVTISATQDQSVAVPNWLFMQILIAAPTTLTAGVSAAATSFPVSAIPVGLALGNGVCISPSATLCAMTMSTNGTVGNLSLSTGEIARVTAISGSGPYTLTVTRGAIGTAAAYGSGQAVTFVKFGSYSDLAAALLTGVQALIVQNCAYGAFSTATQCAAIAAAQAALNVVH